MPSVLSAHTALPTGQAPLGGAELCRDGIPGEEVVRGIRHRGAPTAVDPAAVVLSSTR